MNQDPRMADTWPVEEAPLILSTPRFRLLRRMVRPIRRFFAWFFLVYEERYWRVTGNAHRDELLRETRAIVDWACEELEKLHGLEGLQGVEGRLIERSDLLMQELWRRAEIGLASQAREVQRLQEEVGRLTRENAAILRLTAHRTESTAGSALPEQASAGETVSVAEVLRRDGVAVEVEEAGVGGGGAGGGGSTGFSPNGKGGGGSSDDAPSSDHSPTLPEYEELFEELERGSRKEVMDKAHRYLQYFREEGPIADLGCGRGEFLELLTWAGMQCYGVDIEPRVVSRCRDLGLDARCEDMFQHLRSLPDASLGGIYCAQVVEHLPPERIPELFNEMARTLRPGARAVVETPNPGTFATHIHSFWRDPDHVRPVPAPTLGMAARTAGLIVEDVVYSSPPPEDEQLQVTDAESFDPPLRDLARTFNRTVQQLNDLLYGHQDYAVIAVRPK